MISILCLWKIHISIQFLPLYLHLTSILCICLLHANVQIITRMVISSCPLFIWFVSTLFETKSNTWRVLLSIYWIGYCMIGTCVFSLFLPWTYNYLFKYMYYESVIVFYTGCGFSLFSPFCLQSFYVKVYYQ